MAAALSDKKGESIVALDVRKLSGVTDYYLIATGNSAPHLKALLSGLEHEMEQHGVYSYRRSGTPVSGWMVADYFDVVVHVFSPSQRKTYELEELWNDAPAVRFE